MAGVREKLRRLREEVLGINQRNQEFLFRYNPRHLFPLVDHKITTKKLLQAAGIPVPLTYRVYRIHKEIESLSDHVRSLDDFVLKPARGAGGGGILVIAERRGEFFVKPGGRRLLCQDVQAHLSDILSGTFSLSQRQDEALLEYRIKADRTLGSVSYRGLPDLRILLFRGIPTMAMVRLPTRMSDGRANLHMGGMGVGVDLISGITFHAVLGRKSTSHHPDLDHPVTGLTIPHWNSILEIATRCYDTVPLGYLGVDVVIDAFFGPLVLELNARPGLQIQLANGMGLRPVLQTLNGIEPREMTITERILTGQEIFRQHCPLMPSEDEEHRHAMSASSF